MWHKNNFILLPVLICLSQFSAAQQKSAKPDSSKVYRDIEEFSKKRKSTDFLYGIFLKPVSIPSKSISKIKKKKNLQRPYSEFEGKIIRKINIETLDPFGYSVTDTVVVSQNVLYKAGNSMHVKSQRITIRNLLLIHKNEPFDSLLVKESERLIRSQKYVHEVSFFVVPAGKKSDSVDIFIRELDSWSLIPEGSVSTSSFTIKLTDKNIFGTGHEFQNEFTRNFEHGKNAFNTNYSIPNIRNTYISATLHYGVDSYENFNRSLVVDRAFYSPFAKWAAGIALLSQVKRDSLKRPDLIYVPWNLKFSTQDYWAGVAQQVVKGNSEEERVTHLILAARYLRILYFEKPSELYDTTHLYSNEDFYLFGAGISSRKYVQDKYIFNYGITEDVPAGKVYGLTGGYQVKNNIGRLYLGIRFSYGNYNELGYLSSNFEYGTFYRSFHSEQSVFTASLNYFTDLFEIGNWKFRQFVKPQLTLGINRLASEHITINNENGLRGFNSTTLVGKKKIVVTLQTQSYAPWNVLGFHFGPYLIYSGGLLGNEISGFRNSHVYSQFGFGVLIKNEFLVINNFQLSIAFFPVIPGSGSDIIKLNSNSTTDFGYLDFIIGKPGPVGYQ